MIEKYITESTEYEFKVSLEEIKPKSWLKSVSAFSNGIGGTIIFGIDDNSKVIGIQDVKLTSEKITSLINSKITPKPTIKLVPIKEDLLNVLVLEVYGGINTPYYYASDGVKEAYVRSGTSSIIAPDYMLNELILKGSGQTFDSIVSKYKKSDYSFTYFEATFFDKTKRKITQTDYYSFGLMNDDGYLTNAGCLFADQVIIRQSRIFCTHWNGIDKAAKFEAIDDKEFSGNILRLLDLSLDFCKTNFKKAWYKTEDGRKEMPEYSIESIREIIVNALMHRNYNELGSEVSIDFFSDRLEITSPGGMYDGTILSGEIPSIVKSKRRNPIIADVFSRMDLMDRRGSGFNKIIDSTDSLFFDNQTHAHFYASHSTFQVILDNANYNRLEIARDNARDDARVKLNPMQSRIVELIVENKSITYRELSIKLNVVETTITRNIKKLKEHGILTRKGSDREGFWVVNDVILV